MTLEAIAALPAERRSSSAELLDATVNDADKNTEVLEQASRQLQRSARRAPARRQRVLGGAQAAAGARSAPSA